MKLNTNISLENIVTIIALICSVTLAFGFMQYDIDAIKKDRRRFKGTNYKDLTGKDPEGYFVISGKALDSLYEKIGTKKIIIGVITELMKRKTL